MYLKRYANKRTCCWNCGKPEGFSIVSMAVLLSSRVWGQLAS
uniref:Co-chaperone HscB n=1 Tax=Microviridae sp. ct4S516 TaxID=2826726 RepID=A0A8S5MWA7_9VIRU|nr:MAG TPA: co-chaperone HscB [Microviridae sp. ct4S516]